MKLYLVIREGDVIDVTDDMFEAFEIAERYSGSEVHEGQELDDD